MTRGGMARPFHGPRSQFPPAGRRAPSWRLGPLPLRAAAATGGRSVLDRAAFQHSMGVLSDRRADEPRADRPANYGSAGVV